MTLKIYSRGTLCGVIVEIKSGLQWPKVDSQIEPPMLHRMLMNVPKDKRKLVKKTGKMW